MLANVTYLALKNFFQTQKYLKNNWSHLHEAKPHSFIVNKKNVL